MRDIFERFDFYAQIDRLDKASLLYQVAEKFAGIDLHPEAVSNTEMGTVFEELIRKFAEISNETAGEHFTPREVIRLMVNLLFVEDDDVLAKPGVVRTIYDPTAGTGGMLSVAGEHLAEHNPEARLTMFGQELNDESYAICKADMLIKGQDVANIIPGNTLSDDGHAGTGSSTTCSPIRRSAWSGRRSRRRSARSTRRRATTAASARACRAFQRRLAAVPAAPALEDAPGVGWRQPVRHRAQWLAAVHRRRGLAARARSAATCWRTTWSRRSSRLPTDMFYNTGISTYVWIVSNRKPAARKGKVQLIDASSFWQKMRKSLGSKRKEMSEEQIAEITRLFGDFKEAARFDEAEKLARPISRIFKNEDFGYRTITVERPLRDEEGNVVLGAKGQEQRAAAARQRTARYRECAADEDVEAYFKREVLPHAPMPGSTMRRPRSATRSRSTGTSMSSSRRAICTRSMQN